MSDLLITTNLLTELSDEQQEIVVGGQLSFPNSPTIPAVTLAPVNSLGWGDNGFGFGSPIHGTTTYKNSTAKGNGKQNQLASAFNTGSIY